MRLPAAIAAMTVLAGHCLVATLMPSPRLSVANARYALVSGWTRLTIR
jgi:hypothetical protein